jgi:hypothetical protein
LLAKSLCFRKPCNSRMLLFLGIVGRPSVWEGHTNRKQPDLSKLLLKADLLEWLLVFLRLRCMFLLCMAWFSREITLTHLESMFSQDYLAHVPSLGVGFHNNKTNNYLKIIINLSTTILLMINHLKKKNVFIWFLIIHHYLCQCHLI